MNCSETEKISLLIDRELNATEAQALERHLAACSDCSQAREDFLNLRSQIVSFPSPGVTLTNAALAKILNKQKAPTISPPPIPARWGASYFLPRFAAASALVLAIAIIGGLVFFRQPSNTEVATTTVNNDQAESVAAAGQRRSSTNDAGTAQPPKNIKPKGTKTNSKEGRRPKALDNKNTKPDGGRSTPNRLPQTRNDAPPTYALVDENISNPGPEPLRGSDTLAVQHLEQSELLLRSFRNVRLIRGDAAADVAHESRRAQQLFYQNVLLRREADAKGDVQMSTLLGSLEPILLDIANLRARPRQEELAAITDRMERQSLVALLQINSSTLAKANE